MRAFLIVTFIALLAYPSAAFALSDADYEALKKSSTVFQYADKRLNDAWKGLSKATKKEMRKEQQDWIKSGWDQEAEEYLAKGCKRDCAYALPALTQAAGLEAADYNSSLEDANAAKADSFFLTEKDYGIFDTCGIKEADLP